MNTAELVRMAYRYDLEISYAQAISMLIGLGFNAFSADQYLFDRG